MPYYLPLRRATRSYCRLRIGRNAACLDTQFPFRTFTLRLRNTRTTLTPVLRSTHNPTHLHAWRFPAALPFGLARHTYGCDFRAPDALRHRLDPVCSNITLLAPATPARGSLNSSYGCRFLLRCTRGSPRRSALRFARWLRMPVSVPDYPHATTATTFACWCHSSGSPRFAIRMAPRLPSCSCYQPAFPWRYYTCRALADAPVNYMPPAFMPYNGNTRHLWTDYHYRSLRCHGLSSTLVARLPPTLYLTRQERSCPILNLITWTPDSSLDFHPTAGSLHAYSSTA